MCTTLGECCNAYITKEEGRHSSQPNSKPSSKRERSERLCSSEDKIR